MAKKSKGFSELLYQQQQAKTQEESMNKLAQRVQKGWKGKIAGVEKNPKGEAKMSEVLQAFVEPHLEFAHNLEQRRKMFSIALLAWNLALLPEEEQQKQMQEIIDQMCLGKDRQAQQDIREVLEELTNRKRRSFADYRRYIIDFELQETAQDFHLSVISSQTPKAQQQES
ncbi:MAG: hypothetical protein HY785_27480 [Oscillatoriophycideae cyanobacterium NC_groundwater_1537_Pr4_S-0.65um_50_18]|nr:hypothetical protein [Oscillatoriophycideae cyanobacterium NC_groundwater_1537_Pr4_S-0.65um_50_18]